MTAPAYAPADPAPRPPAAAPPRTARGGGLARAAGLTAALTAAGSLLGLARDQTIAHLFGAGAASDAFLVSWTVPELAATVLIEDAMALLLVPAFSGALTRGAVRGLVRVTLPRLAAVLAGLTAALYAGAPALVGVLAPGLADAALAVDCMRLTAVTVFTFGLAGYLSAVLRAHRRYLPPAAIYLAYNAGIIATLPALHGRLGVRAAAAGVAVGGALMVLVQLPAFRAVMRRAARPAGAAGAATGSRPAGAATGRDHPLGLALLAPVVLFTVSRHAQVLLERFFAAPLRSGAISHLNYAQKIAQLPMVLSLMVCTVTFPVVSQAMARGDGDGARRRVERDLTLAGVVVLLGTAYVVACAPQIVHVLFQRGAFDAADTAATAAALRVYALGLLGQTLVGALVRPYFSAAGPTWYPAAAMAGGLLVTAAVDADTARLWGVPGIAAGNAAGITVTALALLRGLPGRGIVLPARRLAARLAPIAAAATVAATAGWCLTAVVPAPAAAAGACALVVPAVFVAASAALHLPEVHALLATARRRHTHAH